jgi:hypothetical protein
MSGGSKSSETKTEMPGFMKAQAKPLAQGIGQLSASDTPLYAGPSDYTQQAIAGMGSPGGYGQAIDYYQQAAQGDFLGLSPGFQQAVMDPAIEGVASRFAQAGRSGSPGAELAMTKAAMQSLAPYYNDERRMQQQAAAALPMAYQDLYRSQMAAGTAEEGIAQNALENQRFDPQYDLLQRQIGLLQGIPMVGGTSQSVQPGGSPLSGALGGAATGAAIGSAVPGIGTGFGALVGGGLGLLGAI